MTPSIENRQHKPGCMANMACMVYHDDGICPGPYGKCTCATLPAKPESEKLVDRMMNEIQDNIALSSHTPFYSPQQEPYHQRDHAHCFDQETPPCGKGKHTSCCLCERTQQEQERCSKCNNPFEPHHWKHYAPKTGQIFHTGCFEQYKFPSLLDSARKEGFTRGCEATVEEILENSSYLMTPDGNKDYTRYVVDVETLSAARTPKDITTNEQNHEK